jgi:AraC-like DNA-binding protein
MNDIVYATKYPSAHTNVPQIHDCWRFFYCTGGSGSCTTGSLILTCTPGGLLVFPPEVHPTHDSMAEAQGILVYMRHIPLVFRKPCLLQDDRNQSLLHLMQDALWHFEAAAPDAGALLSAYGQLLVRHVSLCRPSAPQSQVVEDLAQSIAQNFANPLFELDEQLRSAPYCYDYLCRLFRQELNTTPHKYLANLRLETAATMLRQVDGRSVTEIARMCGYSDPLYFSRVFKKRYGVSPREYGKAAEE